MLSVLVGLGSWPAALAVEAERTYIVQPGDTLVGISERLGVSVESLSRLNSLDDPHQVVAGQTLVLAAEHQASTTPPAPVQTGGEPRDYLVQPGDTLVGIAQREQIPLGALLSANGLTDPNRLVVGQKLRLPGREAVDRPGPTGAPPAEARPAANPPVGGPGTGAPDAHGDVGALLSDAAQRHRLDPATVQALSWHLSGWRADVTSRSGAVGPMQVTAATQDWVNRALLKRSADRSKAGDNVEIGVAYLAYLVHKQGDERLGLAAYLQGPTGLARDGLSASTTRALEQIYNLRGLLLADQRPQLPPAEPAQPSASGQAPATLSAALPDAIQRLASQARVGVAARHLKSGEQLNLRADELFPSASVNKVAILAEALRQIEAGTVRRTPALDADLGSMIVSSDNDAANRVLDLIGEQSVNATMARLGFGKTVLRNYFAYARGPIEPGFNQTTPAEMAGLLTLLASDRLVSKAASQEMRGLLLQNEDASKLRRGLPAEARLAHKSGWYSGVANDAGIIFGPQGAYVLAVFSQGVEDDQQGNDLVAAVSRLVYEAWGR
jgi:beta-lactamase class A/LysM repeat protein